MLDKNNLPDVTHGYCQCGCGEKTPIAQKTRTHLGHVKGEPVRWIRGHSGKLAKPGRQIPDHVDLRPMMDRGDGVTDIPLQDGSAALIDTNDRVRVEGFNWGVSASTTDRVYVRGRLSRQGSPVYLHRIITDAKPGQTVDHISGDTRDNRRSNLRLVTHQQNTFNRPMSRNNTSGFKGVSRGWNGIGWRATIKVDDRQAYLGTFDTPEEAAKAYDAKARDVHGEFANLNFPEPVE